jgi:diadenosine tetraphosphate (Ap4A) HIT family hydrolase
MTVGDVMLLDQCLICGRINMIKEGTNKYFVKELETGYVVIGDHQYFEGYTLFLCKEHKSELHIKEKFLIEMSIISEAVFKAFKPDKLNYKLLGNGDSHMHWPPIPEKIN